MAAAKSCREMLRRGVICMARKRSGATERRAGQPHLEKAMRSLAVLPCLLLAVAPALAEDLPKPTGKDIVDPEAKLELLYTRSAPISGGLTEGPTAAPDGTIFFSDIPF